MAQVALATKVSIPTFQTLDNLASQLDKPKAALIEEALQMLFAKYSQEQPKPKIERGADGKFRKKE